MTDTTNGWTGKPGVPRDHGLPGAHWLKGYTEDAWMYDGDGGWWGPGYSHNLDAGTVAARYSYLGPCLTPDQTTALQARVTELEVAQARLILSFRLNILRLNPKLSHDTISKAIDAALEGKKDE